MRAAKLAAFLGFCILLSGCEGRVFQKDKPAPDFSLPVFSKSGEKIKFSDINREHPVLLVFWATWCPACVKEFPILNEWTKKYSVQGLRILAVNMEEKPEAVAEFTAKQPVDFPVLMDGEGITQSLYGLQGIPVSVWVAKGGKVLYYGFSLPENPGEFLT